MEVIGKKLKIHQEGDNFSPIKREQTGQETDEDYGLFDKCPDEIFVQADDNNPSAIDPSFINTNKE